MYYKRSERGLYNYMSHFSDNQLVKARARDKLKNQRANKNERAHERTQLRDRHRLRSHLIEILARICLFFIHSRQVRIEELVVGKIRLL